MKEQLRAHWMVGTSGAVKILSPPNSRTCFGLNYRCVTVHRNCITPTKTASRNCKSQCKVHVQRKFVSRQNEERCTAARLFEDRNGADCDGLIPIGDFGFE
jgi:hypothetical protein